MILGATDQDMKTATKPSLSEHKDAKSWTDFQAKFLKTLRFPLLCLTIAGIHLPKKDGEIGQGGFMTKLKRALFRCYTCLVVVLHILNLSRVICVIYRLCIDDLDFCLSNILFLIFQHVFPLATFVSEQIALHIYFPPLMNALDDYEHRFGFRHEVTKWTKWTRLFVIMYVISLPAACALSVVSSNCAVDIFAVALPPSHETHPIFHTIMKVLWVMGMFIGNLIYLGVFIIYAVIESIICKEFKMLAAKLREDLSSCRDGAVEEKFHSSRERHQCLCRAVASLSQVVRVFFLTALCGATGIIFLCIYDVVKTRPLTLDDFLKCATTAVFSFATLMVLVGKWGKLPQAANAIVGAVADVSWARLSPNLMQQIGVLVARCSSQSIGIDIFGLFTVDRSTPLMLAGTILTYGLVVIQFS